MTASRNALIVNVFGGPGGGKTTLGATLFTALKLEGVDVEMDMELARQMILMEHLSALECQPYLFGVALYKLVQTAKNTDVVIMDSPLLLNPIYDKQQSGALRALSLEWHHKFRNLNVFSERPSTAEHSMAGRVHDLRESILLDQRIRSFMHEHEISYETTDGTSGEISRLVRRIVDDVEQSRVQTVLF